MKFQSLAIMADSQRQEDSDSQLFFNRKSKELEKFFLERAGLPLFVGDFARALQIRGEDLRHFLSDVSVIHADIQLFVESERAVVKVGAAHRCPNVVDDHGLRMQESRSIFKDFNTAK